MKKYMEDERRSRSHKYQYKVLEIISSDEFLRTQDNSRGLTGYLNKDSEQIKELEDQLLERMWQLIEIHCTQIQKEVLTLIFKDGYTQQEVAKMKGVNQSSVAKSVMGNNDYSKENKKMYGGSIRKLKKIVKVDSVCNDIISKIDELRE